jgi:hypothetical protein
MIRLRKYPASFLGQKITFDDADTAKERIVYLAETLAKLSFKQPDRKFLEVISTRVSGQSNSFGFGNPDVISFYENSVAVSRVLNPRGFVSPIADNALQFYRYRYMGAFFEDGRQISKILVTPKRAYEPLFRGFIRIVEDEWNIHSVDLDLDKQSQMEFVDRLKIQQLYVPVSGKVWMVQSQTVYPVTNRFGFDANGHFTTVYSDYEIEPAFRKGLFGSTVIRYDSGSNKRKASWWDTIRPLPLLAEESRDFRRKDSLETLRENPAYLDSLDRRQNRLTPVGFLLNGQTMVRRKHQLEWSYEPFLKSFGFNTVEGWNLRVSGTVQKELPGRRRVSLTPTVRYGFNNGHLNASALADYRFGKGYVNVLSVAGGKRVFQFNNSAPIPQLMNSFNTLFYRFNYMKIYEAWFGDVQYTKGLGGGLTLRAGLQYQSRTPLENTDTTTFWGRREEKRNLTPNYPTEISNSNITAHQALSVSVTLRYRPGSRYIEFPDRMVNIGSRYPQFSLSYTHGIRGMIGSDVDYGRWRFTVEQNINMRLAGETRYRLLIGGFLNNRRVELPDYQHFNGNRVTTAGQYLQTFQLAPYYANSNKAPFFSILHLEHRFNGAITNKIPGLRRLNLRLVTGANGFLVDRDNRYLEFFFGLDNVMKVFRFDYVWGYNANGYFDQGIRIGIKAFSTLFDEN